MTNLHSPPPSTTPRPSSRPSSSRSRSLTPRHRYTPPSPRRFPRNSNSALTSPSRKRHRSISPTTSPPRKFSRPSPYRSRSPSPKPYQSRPAYQSYRSPPRHSRRSPDHRYSPHRYRHTRSISPLRYRSPPPRSASNRDALSRRRYYSPRPRPIPSRRTRDYSPQSHHSRYPETSYPPSDSHRPSLRPPYPSRSRSPRRRSDRRGRDRRRRQREPLSPSHRIPAEQVHQLFLEALKLVLRYRRPPFNISVISDYMSSIDRNWSVRKTQYLTFSDLCRLQESRGHLRLARHGESVVINSSRYEPDTLELKPRDLSRRRSQRDRDRVNHRDAHHIDPIRRRDWDLEERAAARKERFREDKDESRSTADAPERSRQTNLDQFEEGAIVTRPRDCIGDNSNERNVSRGSRDDGSGTTTPNGVEATETNATTRSIHCASPPPDSSQILADKPFDTNSAFKAEISLHCPSATKSVSMPSTTEGDEKVNASS